MSNITKVTVVGAGVIGTSWAAYLLARGLQVTVTDPAPGAEARLLASLATLWPSLQPEPDASPEALRFEPELEAALHSAHFVQENGPEREDLKTDLFRRMDAALPPQVILASSSSGLVMSRVQSACRHPERVVLGHPFNPPHLIPLVEVLGGALTSPEVIERTMAFYASIGKRPIRLHKEVPGHVANRLQAALWREAFSLVEQGVATVADIDAAIANGPGLRWALLGPFANLHLSGGPGGLTHLLDHLGPAIDGWWQDLGTPSMTPELKATVVQQLQHAAPQADWAAVAQARDALLTDLLAAKQARPAIDPAGS
jgi:3-hydroxyacyl-CoA dehydrogenase